VVEHSHGFAIRFCHDGGRTFFQVRDTDRDLCFHTLHFMFSCDSNSDVLFDAKSSTVFHTGNQSV
jgi:hypothetical protein